MNRIAKIILPCLLALPGALAHADDSRLIHIKGSDTMIHVAHSWAEAFERVHPGIALSVGGGGSGTGIDALLNGTVEVANASRRMTTHEIERARRLGMKPIEHIVGYDALAVFLNASNSLTTISVSELAEVFSEGGKIRKWTDLNVDVPECKGEEIVRVGRQNNSGTYVYFRQTVLEKGRDYDLGILDMLSSKDVVRLIEKTPCAIGYSGMAFASSKVRMACIRIGDDSGCVKPSTETAVDGSYPIARPLFMYTSREPTGPLKTYIEWILGDEGQCVLLEKGYAPMRPVFCP